MSTSWQFNEKGKRAQLLIVGIVLVPRVAGFFLHWQANPLITFTPDCSWEADGMQDGVGWDSQSNDDKIRIVILHDAVSRCGSIHGDLCGCNRMEKYF